MATAERSMAAAERSLAAETPTVAHCIAGLTRSLALPLVYQSLKYHLIDAFGARSSVFLLVKAWELAPEKRVISAEMDVAWEQPESELREQLKDALALLRPVELRVVHASQETPERLVNKACDVSGGRTGLRAYCSSPSGLMRMVGQFSATQSCLDMIVGHERARGFRFDWITRSRPDLGVLQPIQPWHALHAKANRSVLIDSRDWLTIARRHAAEAALGAPALYYSCRGKSHLTTPEVFLRAAIKRGGFAVATEPFPLALVSDRLCNETCPPPRHAQNLSASDPALFVSYFNYECRRISGDVGCFGLTPVHCRNDRCAHVLRHSGSREAFAELAVLGARPSGGAHRRR